MKAALVDHDVYVSSVKSDAAWMIRLIAKSMKKKLDLKRDLSLKRGEGSLTLFGIVRDTYRNSKRKGLGTPHPQAWADKKLKFLDFGGYVYRDDENYVHAQILNNHKFAKFPEIARKFDEAMMDFFSAYELLPGVNQEAWVEMMR